MPTRTSTSLLSPHNWPVLLTSSKSFKCFFFSCGEIGVSLHKCVCVCENVHICTACVHNVCVCACMHVYMCTFMCVCCMLMDM